MLAKLCESWMIKPSLSFKQICMTKSCLDLILKGNERNVTIYFKCLSKSLLKKRENKTKLHYIFNAFVVEYTGNATMFDSLPVSVHVKMALLLSFKIVFSTLLFFLCMDFVCCNNGRRVCVKHYYFKPKIWFRLSGSCTC